MANNNIGPLNPMEVKNTVDLLMGIINPDEHIQQRVVLECTSSLCMDYPQAAMVYSRHYYYVYMNLSWFKYFLFTVFIKRGLIRDMKKEISEVDPNCRGVSVYNRFSPQAISLIKH
jgi:hypothetical protein